MPKVTRTGDERAFLDAINDNPNCMTTRLAFADWLQEHDRPEYEGWLATVEYGVELRVFNDGCGVFEYNPSNQPHGVSYRWYRKIERNKHINETESWFGNLLFILKSKGLRPQNILRAVVAAYMKMTSDERQRIGAEFRTRPTRAM